MPDIIPKNVDTTRIAQLIKIQGVGNKQDYDAILAARLFMLMGGKTSINKKISNQLIINKKTISLLDSLKKNINKTHRFDTHKIQEILYFFGTTTSRLILDVTAVMHNLPPATHRTWVTTLQSLRQPVFPVAGKDLLQRGMASGPEMGRILTKIERRWITSGFTLTKADLLEKL